MNGNSIWMGKKIMGELDKRNPKQDSSFSQQLFITLQVIKHFYTLSYLALHNHLEV